MLEKGKHRKIAYKLSEKVLHPKSIEKSNVKLADPAFHESTINALLYYASRGYPHFKNTAIFIRIIRDWFSTINVKSSDYGQRSRDERKNAVYRSTMDEDLAYLSQFCIWINKWRESGKSGYFFLQNSPNLPKLPGPL